LQNFSIRQLAYTVAMGCTRGREPAKPALRIQAWRDEILRKQPITFNYIIFYLIFLPDTWQILVGVAAAWLIVPSLTGPAMGAGARIMLYFMCATIGYAVSRIPAKWISRKLTRLILGDKHP
jgi:hypothetical protein